MNSNIPNSVPIAEAATIKDKLEALKVVSESGKSTQETHRKAIDASTNVVEKYMDVLSEQSKKAESIEERETIRRDAKEAVAQHAQHVNSHKQDSNSVFTQILGFGVVAVLITTTISLALVKSKD